MFHGIDLHAEESRVELYHSKPHSEIAGSFVYFIFIIVSFCGTSTERVLLSRRHYPTRYFKGLHSMGGWEIT